ncbi:MAG: type II secretion system inner membrane protein GspF [Pseudomonadales bacterium]|nr:type II secretion system inner membrane protein GspF [Pseudomonadales bacterium]MCP5185782.1 type II secretion system inner membrane protein GspF [Pseudomonadales bacterium]
MAAFEYIALDARGRERKGVIESDSQRQARQQLRDQGLAPLEVQPAAEKQGGQRSELFARRGINRLERVLITRQLATLVRASLPLEEALHAIAQQADNQRVRSLVMGIRSKVLEGYSLAASLAEYPRSFTALYRSTVASGEQSGHLDRVLENLADYLERQYESSRNVEMALIYPVTLLVLAVLIVGALMVYVVPDMVSVIENAGQQLPPMTVVLIALSEFLASWWWVVLGLTGAGALLVRWLLRQPQIRLRWDHRLLHLPLVRRISRSANAARYANTLAILGGSGVPLVEGMSIAQDVVANTFLRDRLKSATQRVSEGSSLRSALEGVGYFPPMLLHMVASGEASGELDTMLDRVARHQQSEVERLVATVVGLFQPAMLIVMGGVVLFIVMAVLLPILNMNQAI